VYYIKKLSRIQFSNPIKILTLKYIHVLVYLTNGTYNFHLIHQEHRFKHLSKWEIKYEKDRYLI
jgi:hypothetical protein